MVERKVQDAGRPMPSTTGEAGFGEKEFGSANVAIFEALLRRANLIVAGTMEKRSHDCVSAEAGFGRFLRTFHRSLHRALRNGFKSVIQRQVVQRA